MISEKHYCFYAAPLYSLLNTRKNNFNYFLFTNLDLLKVHWWKEAKTEIHDGKTYKWHINLCVLFCLTKVFSYHN